MSDIWDGDLPPAGTLVITTRTGQKIPFESLVRINVEDLTTAWTTHAAWSGFFNYQASIASSRVDHQKRKIKALEGAKHLYYKTLSSDQKLTVQDLKSKVDSDPELEEANTLLTALQREAGTWEAAKWAWGDRKDMLIQLGADQRSDKKYLG